MSSFLGARNKCIKFWTAASMSVTRLLDWPSSELLLTSFFCWKQQKPTISEKNDRIQAFSVNMNAEDKNCPLHLQLWQKSKDKWLEGQSFKGQTSGAKCTRWLDKKSYELRFQACSFDFNWELPICSEHIEAKCWSGALRCHVAI